MSKSNAALPDRQPAPPPGPERKSRRGRPVGNRDAKRLELLKAAVAVLAEAGYAGTSMRKVAHEARHTTGAMSYYFDNKETMIRQIIEHLFDQYDLLLDQTPEDTDMKGRLKQALDLNDDIELWRAQFQLLAQAPHDRDLAAVYQRRYADYRDMLAAILAKRQGVGMARGDIPADILSDLVSAMFDGWLMTLPVEPERLGPDRLDALLDALMLMITPAGKAREAGV